MREVMTNSIQRKGKVLNATEIEGMRVVCRVRLSSPVRLAKVDMELTRLLLDSWLAKCWILLLRWLLLAYVWAHLIISASFVSPL